MQDRLGTKAIGFDTTHNVRMNELSFSEVLRGPTGRSGSFWYDPEFIGRLPMVAVLDELSNSDLCHILQNTKNALIKQYAKLCSMEGVVTFYS